MSARVLMPRATGIKPTAVYGAIIGAAPWAIPPARRRSHAPGMAIVELVLEIAIVSGPEFPFYLSDFNSCRPNGLPHQGFWPRDRTPS